MHVYPEVHNACSYSTVLVEEVVDAVAGELQPFLYSAIHKTAGL